MGDRRTESDKVNLDEANFGIRGNAKDLNQLSSSGRAAQDRRSAKAMKALAQAGKNLEEKEKREEKEEKDGKK